MPLHKNLKVFTRAAKRALTKGVRRTVSPHRKLIKKGIRVGRKTVKAQIRGQVKVAKRISRVGRKLAKRFTRKPFPTFPVRLRKRTQRFLPLALKKRMQRRPTRRLSRR